MYDADSASEHDYIGISAVADAFAYLIASRTSQPPLAIGLFGEWGSGKSFLMSAIKKRVDQITRAARESDRPPGELGVHKRVVQVEFNAWHYVEGNLWASLVDHIFANLRVTPEESATTLETRRRAINDKLASTTAQREALQRRIAQLEEERQAKDDEMSSLRTKQRANLEQARRITFGDAAAATKLDDADQQSINAALGAVGLNTVDATAVEAVAALSDARDVARRGGAILAPLRGRGLWWLALVVLAICAAPGAAFLLEYFDVPTAPKVLTSVAAAASAGVALFHNGTGWISSVIGRIESAESAVRARVDQTVAEQARNLAAIQQDIDQTDAELADALGKRHSTQELIDDLKREKTGLTPGKILSEFLDARASSRDYQKHLGLTALIRRDFEELSRLIKAVHEGPDGGIADFSRVVLFVDDLDRCPPARVVEVLQAVHLLLSFPVFTVVVAVDPRWLSRSLQKHFAGLIDSDEIGRSGEMSTAQDYLEKIFQIPYRVGPLDHSSQRLFLRGMLADVLEKPVTSDPPPLSTLPIDDELLDRLTSRERELGPPVFDDAPMSRFRFPRHDPTTNPQISTPVEVDLSPSSLELDPHEAAYLDQLLPILDSSPRGLKRYVNIYRLIKTVLATNGTAPTVAVEAVAERRMFLLAVVTSMTCGADLAAYLAGPEPLSTHEPSADPESSSAGDPPTVAARTAEYFASSRGARYTAEGLALQRWLSQHTALATVRAAELTADAQHIRLYSFV
jgi:peptidoglycan hydrolase CwlO-like protein